MAYVKKADRKPEFEELADKAKAAIDESVKKIKDMKEENPVVIKKEVKEKEVKVDATKRTAVMNALKAVQKTFGERSVFLGNDSKVLDISSIPTGSMSLNCAIGVGGFPRGRITEVSGQEGSGKTLVALTAIAECQKAGGIAVFIDAECALSKPWCKALGVDFDKLIVSQPESGEEALQTMERFIDSNGVDIIVLDSVAALVTKAEIEGEMGDQHMAQLARLMAVGLKKLSPKVSRTNTACVFINQLRANIGAYGNPEITPGGKALKFFASLRLKVGKVSQSDKKDKAGNRVGHRLKVTCIKNKVAAPFKEAEFDLYYLKGIDKKSEVATLATQKGIVVRPNNRRYEYGKLVWSSKAEYEEALSSDEKLMEEIMNKTIEAINNNVADVEVGAANVQTINGALVDITTGEVLDAEAAQEGEVSEVTAE